MALIMSNTVIQCRNVSFGYKTVDINGRKKIIPVFTSLDLSIAQGQVVTIMGHSGCGKTTILNLMNGLLAAQHGDIFITAKHPVTVFQDKRLIPWKTIGDNLYFGANEMGIKLSANDISDALVNVGLPAHIQDGYPKILSGGMQQRVALARALVCQPDVLFLDEPFSALDVNTKNDLMYRISNYISKANAAVVFVYAPIERSLFFVR